MAYRIQCLKCETDTWARDIIDLIQAHTDDRGRLVCAGCSAPGGYIHWIAGLWDGYIKAVLRLTPKSPMYTLYVFLTADSADGEVSGVRFSYYKDLGLGGRRTDGPSSGGAPALTLTDVVQLLKQLGALGLLDQKTLESIKSRLARESQVAVGG